MISGCERKEADPFSLVEVQLVMFQPLLLQNDGLIIDITEASLGQQLLGPVLVNRALHSPKMHKTNV